MKGDNESLPDILEESQKDKESFGSFRRAGFGEIRNGLLPAHHSMHLGAAHKQHLPDFPILHWA